MSVEETMSRNAAPSAAQEEAHSRLRGRALFFARALWFIAVAVVLGLYALSVPLQAQVLQTACADNCQYGQLTAAQLQELSQLGLSLNFYISFQIALNTIFFFVFFVVGALIFWRKSSDWFGIFVALALVLFGISFGNPLPLIAKYYPAFSFPSLVLAGIGGTLIGIFMYLFPDGRFVPRWTRWLVPFVAAREFASGFGLDTPILTAAFLIELASFLFAQIYRYRRASSAVARQQTKWFVYGVSVAILGFTSLILVFGLSSPDGKPTSVLLSLIAGTALYLFVLLIPLSIMMAILRYRLWDIDLLINRTLVYVPLTAILAGVFAASITLTQKFFVALTGQSSDAATVLTTLIVVAAFEPLKAGLQNLVNRRFKPPSKKFGAFGEQLRAFVELHDRSEVARRLLDETATTLDAKSGAVYLDHNGQSELVYQLGEWKGDAVLTIPLTENGAHIGELSLSARRNDTEYTEEERASVAEIGALVARVIAIAERTDMTDRMRQ